VTNEHGGEGYSAAVLTVSDGVAARVREDRSGDAVCGCLVRAGYRVRERLVVADDRQDIVRSITRLTGVADLVATTGGTGFGPRDVTPEATRDVIEREAPGLAEEMRRAGAAGTRFALLSRGVCGTKGRSLVLNLPGSPRGAVESLEAVLDILPHALAVLTSDSFEHGT
jgi:molybdopterin adenylyltransferase